MPPTAIGPIRPLRPIRPILLLLALTLLLASQASATPPDASTAGERIATLRAEIARHDQLYYRDAAPEISDRAYDRLRLELADLERRFPDAAASVPASPRAGVGDDRAPGFSPWTHRAPMLSLENLYNESQLRVWLARAAARLGADAARIPCSIEPKIDGVAISLVYENGRLTRAATRGDGRTGDDVTANLLAARIAPLQLRLPSGQPPPAFVEIRGELCLTHADFRLVNQERAAAGQPPFANPRNLAAGSIKLRDPSAIAARRLTLVCYAIGARGQDAGAPPATQIHALRQLQDWGLPVIEHWVRAETIDDICAAVTRLDAARRRDGLPWPADGVVVKLDSFAAQSSLGATDHAPRWAVACKYSGDSAETRLLAITHQIGRTGVVTPVAELAPVTVGGVTVTRASLHNAAQIARLDLRVGDTVILERAGEVIPAIVGVNLASRPADATPYRFPSACPSCHAALVQLPGETAWRCPSAACPAQLQRRLAHYVSKPCMDIPGLGPARINDLVQRGLLKTPADLYRLRPEDLAPSPNQPPGKAAHALIEAIATSKHRPFSRLLLSLGIPNIGPANAQALAGQFESLDALAAAAREDPRSSIGNLGATAAASLRAWLETPDNLALIADLRQLGVE